MKNSQKFFGILTLTLLTACPGTRTGNPDTVLSMTASNTTVVAQFNWFEKIIGSIFPFATAFAPMTVITDLGGNTVDLTDAAVGIESVEFKTGETADGIEEEEIELTGPYFIDLFATTPDVLGVVSVPAQGYRRIKMKLHKPEDDAVDVPAALGTNSIYIAGTVNMAAFSFATEEESEFEMGGSNPITPTSQSELLAVIRMGELIQSIDLTDLSTAGDKNITESNRVTTSTVMDPCPSIESNAPDLFTCFRNGLEAMSEFGKDSDGDGQLEDDEESTDD
jgi:hypothetical protein